MSGDIKIDGPSLYCIRVKGVLDRKWADWFDGFDIRYEAGDVTLLVGAVRDQAALHGMLAKIRDLGLPLLMVQWMQDQISER